ncbi:hypothetical protein CYY_002631 [Polysphondylium violaceum]|uniref:Micro-fibrillar-associated protein 1 C-terminal domain-containing protein n=1 Tax=Polysphondylium violaceum TaxID=133409 RepID=A0A8J4V6Q4_9MYCE|nr:hypothetical protein CYY_002631 [Polysphondylium violaceum]
MSVASRIREKLNNASANGGGKEGFGFLEPTAQAGPKVHIYRAGHVPEYAKDSDDQDTESFTDLQNEKIIREAEMNDPRLSRFKNRQQVSSTDRLQSRRHRHDDDNDDEKEIKRETQQTGSRRVIQKTEIVSQEEEQEDTDESRRRKARERYLASRQQEQPQINKEEQEEEEEEEEEEGDDEEEEDEDEDEEEEDEEDDNDNDYWNVQPVFRPTFVKKEARATIKTEEELIKEDEQAEIEREREKELRKIEAHRKLKEELERDEKEQALQDLENKQDISDGDGDPDKEYEEWIERELGRLRISIRAKLLEDYDQKELERRRKMTDKEIQEEDADILVRQPKTKLKFLQKQYHRGAFFQDDEYIKNKDFSGATGEDQFNRELLPEIMQVRNFGKAGRAKYTSLKNQDTTSKEALWNQNKSLVKKYYDKMGGK